MSEEEVPATDGDGDVEPSEYATAENTATEAEGQEDGDKSEGKEVQFDLGLIKSPDETIYELMYEPSILIPWKDYKRLKDSYSRASNRAHKTARDISVFLTDDNVNLYGNLSRVGWKSRVDYAIQEYEQERRRYLATRTNIQNDSNKLLEIATATVILMAKDPSKIPTENYMYTEIYLKNIRDEYDNHPPNIKQLLKHIRYLKKKFNIDWGEFTELEVPNNLVVAKIKRSRIPVLINRKVRLQTEIEPKESGNENDNAEKTLKFEEEN